MLLILPNHLSPAKATFAESATP